MVEPFQEVNFLIRSESRVEVLSALADRPQTARELVDKIGISETTVNRTLDKLSQRGWVREASTGYETTTLGDMIAADYQRLQESVTIGARLGPEIELLPVEQMDFDLRHLTEARMTDPEERDVLRIIDRWMELIARSNRVRTLVRDTGKVAAETVSTACSEGLDFEGVLPPRHLVHVRRTPALRDAYREIVKSGGDLYVASEDPSKPYSVATFDGLCAIAGFDESGSIKVGIETRSEPVREWVERTYESHLKTAEPLSRDDFDP